MAGKRLLAERGTLFLPSPMGAGVRTPSPSRRFSFSPSVEASGAARFSKGRYPPTLTMVTEAIGALNEKKGSSTVAIKRYIRHNYPGVDPIRLKYYLRKALLKGLEKGYLVRPLNSSAQGATGRFKLADMKPKKGKAKRAQPAQGQGPPPKLEKAAAEGKARAENPKGKGKAVAEVKEVKEKAASKKAKAESDPVLAAGPAKPKAAAKEKAPKKPKIPKTLQVKLAKSPSKVSPKREAKTAAKGKARPKAGAGGKDEPPEDEPVKAAKGSQAKSQAGASKARAPKTGAPKTGAPKTGAPKTGAPKAGKKAVAKGKEKEAHRGAGPEDA